MFGFFFLPAVGARANPAGALSGQGTNGWYSPSHVSSSSWSFLLAFTSTVSNPGLNNGNMAHAHLIRCVR